MGQHVSSLNKKTGNVTATDVLGSVPSGTNLRMGRATLVAGTVTVPNTLVTATTNIFLECQVPGGTPGFLRVSARVNGTSFTILSSSNTDTSEVAWVMYQPAV